MTSDASIREFRDYVHTEPVTAYLMTEWQYTLVWSTGQYCTTPKTPGKTGFFLVALI